MMTKFPILLPKKHHLTSLIVQDAHRLHLHSGVNTTATHIRQKYWIPAIRQCVHARQAVSRKCVTCRRVVGKAYIVPDPPPLPKTRVVDNPPFTVTGVDFSGALYVKQSNGSETKAHICLFNCVSTRAVHLEVVTDLTKETLPHDGITNEAGRTVAAAADHATLNRMVRRHEQLVQQFYRHWRTEYLTSLREQHRASGSNTQTINIGDVVQIHDEDPRC